MLKNKLIILIIFIVAVSLNGCAISNKKNLKNDLHNELKTDEILNRILDNVDKSENGIDIEIKTINVQPSGINVDYLITAKESVYVVDYNKIDCENEIRERLVQDGTLYIIFHADLDLLCKPYTLYEVSPSWTLRFLKKGESIEIKTFVKKDPFWDQNYAKQMQDIKKLKLVFGYTSEERLKESNEYIEKVDEKYLKTRKVDVHLNKYKVVDPDISWDEKNPY